MIDRRFRRIARRLEVAELTEKARGAVSTLLGLGGEANSGLNVEHRFLDFYSPLGMHRVVKAYGIHDHLVEFGLGSYRIDISRSEDGRSRLQLLLDGVNDDDHRLIDLMASRRAMKESELGGRPGRDLILPTLYVEWIAMQNPRAEFPPDGVPLPGQRFPGLGLATTFHNVVLLMGRRLGHAAVVNVPERLHLALFYQRWGYRVIDPDRGVELASVAYSLGDLPTTLVAWAAELGAIRQRGSDGSERPWSYRPTAVVAPFSWRLRRTLDRGRWRQRLAPGARRRFTIDRDHLRRQLAANPVPGVDADLLLA